MEIHRSKARGPAPDGSAHDGLLRPGNTSTLRRNMEKRAPADRFDPTRFFPAVNGGQSGA
jgi:hypothetical protein